MEKVDDIQELIGKVRREMGTLRKKSTWNAGNQNTVTEIKNAIDGLISWLDMSPKSINELKDKQQKLPNWNEKRTKKTHKKTKE